MATQFSICQSARDFRFFNPMASVRALGLGFAFAENQGGSDIKVDGMIRRRKTRAVNVGGVVIGGDAPVSVQTMTRAAADDVEGNVREISAAAAAGCDVARMAVPSAAMAPFFGRVAARSPIPVVADTHFDWRTTVAAIREGAAKVRINPGNMDPDGLSRVVDLAGERGIPIRIGGNSGSIRHRGVGGDGVSMARLLAEESLLWCERMGALGFGDIVVSVKAHDAAETVEANRIIAARSDYPLHLGVTAAGPREDSLLKSAAAMGSLLLDGIGDTLRFSFTGEVVGEVEAGRDLLRALGLSRGGVALVSCPACGRCRVPLSGLVAEVKRRLVHVDVPMTVAVMGCEVNGPGEASSADLGIASAGGVIHLFVRGEVVDRLAADVAVDRLVAEAERLAAARRAEQRSIAEGAQTTQQRN